MGGHENLKSDLVLGIVIRFLPIEKLEYLSSMSLLLVQRNIVPASQLGRGQDERQKDVASYPEAPTVDLPLENQQCSLSGPVLTCSRLTYCSRWGKEAERDTGLRGHKSKRDTWEVL